jgi:DNA-directed RNA polymerase subunit K/omega
MKKLSESRSLLLDNDKCVEMAGGNKFDLVLIAAQRCRELRRADRLNGVQAPLTSLLEIQSGKVGKEYLKKLRKT